MAHFGFDAAGQMVTRTFPNGDLTTYPYYLNGRAVSIQYTDATRVTMSYDANGNRVSLIDSAGRTTLVYDVLNRKTSENRDGIIFNSFYDANGNRILFEDSEGTHPRDFTYDADNRLTTFTDGEGRSTGYAYDSASRKTTQTFNDGSKRRYTYDADSQLVSLIDEKADGTVLQRFTFTYDGTGNRITILDSIGAVTSYTYDDKSRLTKDGTTGTGAHVYTYSYDGNDNRISSSENGSVESFKYNAFGQLVTSTGGASGLTTYSYDINGNLVSTINDDGDRSTMVYDKENRMVVHQSFDSKSSTASVATYTYDGDGLKRTEKVDGALATLVWDGADYVQERN